MSTAGVPLASGELRARCPRSLLDLGSDPSPTADVDGLIPVILSWSGSRIQSVKATSEATGLVLPRLVEPHAHLDKAFSWNEYPNPAGTYPGALAANFREHETRSAERVQQRAERALQLAWDHGLRAVRSHIDSLGPAANCSWEVLSALRARWRERIELQLVALVPVEHWSTPEGQHLAAEVAQAQGVIGGVLAPPCRGRATRRALRRLLELADQHGCPVDLHIDEAASHPAAGVRQLLRVLESMSLSVPVTCSHASSLSLLSACSLQRLATRMARQNLQVVALPLTNGWLLGHRDNETPLRRPLAPIRQLQRAGVSVAVGGDNVQDPWFPGGRLDPLALIAMCLPLAQLAPWDDHGMKPFGTDAARLMGLAWDGCLRAGAPADLIHLPEAGWPELLAMACPRRVLASGHWVQDWS
ncbi:amidohydrolase family protein [Synechococcus sp. MIT S9508]|uniref:amidohydrolase family protein n=1 Tax=Synechococcus sp. MIT S9508 TaxID=1801629 RepID=UPI0007BBF08B|nr:amidohydrolase family protein [Synechococcus sp. MIT S9508]KZR89994.1 Cytosine deaminase [Synechococcus sp. MIT S9508]